LSQTNLFRFPMSSGPVGILVVTKSLQHAHLNMFHLNNIMDRLRHF